MRLDIILRELDQRLETLLMASAMASDKNNILEEWVINETRAIDKYETFRIEKPHISTSFPESLAKSINFDITNIAVLCTVFTN